ncbi:unnamed protein product [Clonostachys rhizophaga]|uniref:Glycoside hydrolase family 71 protein n=1 Tax=Clonostachys rhizophaga TaxID=160324 RepID=A0A9N9YQ56_9HYPO|nr:unnamed protein product [Clonostachys rhizophaga]
MLLKSIAVAFVALTGLASAMPTDVTAQPASTLKTRANVPRSVFAHYMLGLTSGQSYEEWQTEINDAKGSGIDGFALNAGPDDAWNADQLANAFNAADAAGFKLFISFDMGDQYNWSVDQVTSWINSWKGRSSYFSVDGLPFVSTFGGPGWADNWAAVRSGTGGIFLVPEWASIGPAGVANQLDKIDGAFSWNSWPKANGQIMFPNEDRDYQQVLGDKAYMMGVSPYFYVDLPNWGKNWYSSSDSLWFDRLKMTQEVMPSLIQIITWNDYSESSYLKAPVAHQIVSGAEAYVNGHDHTALRFVLPYFINSYKAGTTDGINIDSEGAVVWYRTTPKSVCGDGGTVWGQGGSQSATLGTEDVVSVIALRNDAGTVDITVGGVTTTASAINQIGKAYHYKVPLNGRTGDVTVSFNGLSATGPSITDACPSTGNVNFNAVSFQV